MRLIALLLVTLLISFPSNGQTRTIIGRVLDEDDLKPMPGVLIQTSDTLRLGMTDTKGNFKIDLPYGSDELRFSFIGMELTFIKAPINCSNLEIIMMLDAIYDFVTIDYENRKRYKRFKSLKKKHRLAHEKGTFTSDSPCFTYVFREH